MGNLNLARRDTYLNHIRGVVKPDTIAALRTAPLHIPTLFPDSIIKWAEEEIAHFEANGQSSSRSKDWYHPYECTVKRSDKRSDSKSDGPAWKNIGKGSYKKSKPRASSPINDNYCIAMLQRGLLAGSQNSTRQTINTSQSLNVNYHVVPLVHSAPWHSQKRELSPGSAGCSYRNHKLKYVKSVSQLSCVQPVTSVKNAAQNLPVGARL